MKAPKTVRYILAENYQQFKISVKQREMYDGGLYEYCYIQTDDYEKIQGLNLTHENFSWTGDPACRLSFFLELHSRMERSK